MLLFKNLGLWYSHSRIVCMYTHMRACVHQLTLIHSLALLLPLSLSPSWLPYGAALLYHVIFTVMLSFTSDPKATKLASHGQKPRKP